MAALIDHIYIIVLLPRTEVIFNENPADSFKCDPALISSLSTRRIF